MTIDELARAAGMTTRNVRAYQDRGLVPPPERVGRTGYYDDMHLKRLQVISRLLSRGFSLASIHDLLLSWEQGRNLEDVLGFEEALADSFDSEAPVELTQEQLNSYFGNVSARQAKRASDLGYIRPTGDGRFSVPSLPMLEVGMTLVNAGYTLDALLDETENLRADAQRIAERWAGLWDRFVAKIALEAGEDYEQRINRITESINQGRTIPAQIGATMIAQAFSREINLRAAELLRSVPASNENEQATTAPKASPKTPPNIPRVPTGAPARKAASH